MENWYKIDNQRRFWRVEELKELTLQVNHLIPLLQLFQGLTSVLSTIISSLLIFFFWLNLALYGRGAFIPNQRSKMEIIAKIINDSPCLFILAKSAILDVYLGSKYTWNFWKQIKPLGVRVKCCYILLYIVCLKHYNVIIRQYILPFQYNKIPIRNAKCLKFFSS